MRLRNNMTRKQLLQNIGEFQTPLQEKNEERLHEPNIEAGSICITIGTFLIVLGIICIKVF
jgi:hypothetical protein